ncbi:helix-turn-helix domain-containing protein [Mycolicibacterium fortuitum]|uniref:helix-turn-helix domain-containing protein n=1 Tax=Mycolicibacterium fortuitum TaxID=1766 RepID=UPI0026312FD7|nr:helix-turn-helix domain-containing protein [Mycolicibacterium fortuitum]
MDFERIRTLRARRAELASEVEALDNEIAVLIRQANEDHGATEIARELGITRARVYQIIRRSSDS